MIEKNKVRLKCENLPRNVIERDGSDGGVDNFQLRQTVQISGDFAKGAVMVAEIVVHRRGRRPKKECFRQLYVLEDSPLRRRGREENKCLSDRIRN